MARGSDVLPGTWRQAIADCILDIVHREGRLDFSLPEVYAYEGRLQSIFPDNKHVRPKIRQQLQHLRDFGFLLFSNHGRYTLNRDFEDLAAEEPRQDATEAEALRYSQSTRRIRLRDTLMSTELKRLYEYTCQVCREKVVINDRASYAEGHHLQPLGGPHLGPDIRENIIVVCPNHHVQFDKAAIAIHPESGIVVHRTIPDFLFASPLHVRNDHGLDPQFVQYHYARFLGSIT